MRIAEDAGGEGGKEDDEVALHFFGLITVKTYFRKMDKMRREGWIGSNSLEMLDVCWFWMKENVRVKKSGSRVL